MVNETKSILVVDDDELLRETLSKALLRRGHTVEKASCNKHALEIIQIFSPDWAIVDIRMPDDLGLQLIEPLKAKFPNIKILILTGYGSIATAVHSIKLGAYNYLTKPADVEAIIGAFSQTPEGEASPPNNRNTLSDFEWEYIQGVLLECGGNISQAAKILGIHRRSLQRKLNSNNTDRQITN